MRASVRLQDGTLAGDAQITAEYHRVSLMAPGRAPDFYHSGISTASLNTADLDWLLQNDIGAMDGQLVVRLRQYESLPESVQVALLDMAFNLGASGLLNGFPRMVAAVAMGNYGLAAALCHRQGPGAARNDWCHDMMVKAGAM